MARPTNKRKKPNRYSILHRGTTEKQRPRHTKLLNSKKPSKNPTSQQMLRSNCTNIQLHQALHRGSRGNQTKTHQHNMDQILQQHNRYVDLLSGDLRTNRAHKHTRIHRGTLQRTTTKPNANRTSKRILLPDWRLQLPLPKTT